MRCASLLNPGLSLQRYWFWSNCAFWTTRLVSVCCVVFCNGFSLSTIFSGGSRGAPLPPHFFTKLRPERPKHFFEAGPPLFSGFGWPPPPPLSEGLDPPMILESATEGILALIPFKNRKIIKFFGLRAVTVTPKINFIHGYNQVVNWSLIDIMGGFRGGSEWAAPPFSVKFPIIFKEFSVK